MNYTKFSIRIPKALRDLLKNEAVNESRSLNNQITVILKERYSPPIKTHTSQSHTAVAKNGNRKTKAEVS
jgi:hypothetical protein